MSRELVRMVDQRSLTSTERTFCEDVATWFQRLGSSREEYPRKHGLSPEIYIPAGNWTLEHDFYDKTQILNESKRYEHLRMFATHFTGWPIFSFW
jgi:hypothetical protein